jgi:hypothetical protein
LFTFSQTAQLLIVGSATSDDSHNAVPLGTDASFTVSGQCPKKSVLSGFAANRPELQKLVAASGFGAHSIGKHKLAIIAVFRAEPTSCKAA